MDINGLIVWYVRKMLMCFAGKISKAEPEQDIEWADEDGIYYGALPLVGDVVPPLHTKSLQ